jgi:hypothetical protein
MSEKKCVMETECCQAESCPYWWETKEMTRGEIYDRILMREEIVLRQAVELQKELHRLQERSMKLLSDQPKDDKKEREEYWKESICSFRPEAPMTTEEVLQREG